MRPKTKQSYKKLRRLSLSQRMKEIQNPSMGNLLSLLTPTQYAELFPKYYRKEIEVAGFLKTMPTSYSRLKGEHYQKEMGRKVESEISGPSSGIAPGSAAGAGVGKQKKGMFENKVVPFMKKLQQEFGLSKAEAAVVAGNVGHESGGMNAAAIEGSPNKFGTRGIGYAQWTNTPGSPRRDMFEQWARDKGLDPYSDAASEGYIFHELRTKYKRAIDALKAAKTNEEKMYVFEKYYEGAGIKHYDSRFRYMNRALAAYDQAEKNAQAMTLPPGDGVNPSRSFRNNNGWITSEDSSPNNSKQCASLTKAFQPNVGRASTWQVGSAEGIRPGVAIATKSYNGAGGGKTAAQLGRSLYHTGIALSTPDAEGNVLILDQANGYKAKVTKINIHTSNGGQWGVIKGGEEPSIEAIKYARSIAPPEYASQIGGEEPLVAPSLEREQQREKTRTAEVQAPPQKSAPKETTGAPSLEREQQREKEKGTATPVPNQEAKPAEKKKEQPKTEPNKLPPSVPETPPGYDPSKPRKVPVLGPQTAEVTPTRPVPTPPIKPREIAASDKPPVAPTPKPQPSGPAPEINPNAGMEEQMARMQQMITSMQQGGGGMPQMPMPIMGGGGNDLIGTLLNLTKIVFMNPSFSRAMQRTKFAEMSDEFGMQHNNQSNNS